jgi:excisionase family DNA binding protein
MELLTATEVAKRLRISKPTLYDLLRSGQLASLKIGRARRIPASAVDAFIRARLDAESSDDAA